MADSPENWSIEPLSAAHQREAFACGHASLDDFLKRFANQNERLGISRTFVAVRRGETVVAGYYAISARAVDFETMRRGSTGSTDSPNSRGSRSTCLYR